MARNKMTRVQRIMEAQATVERWLQTLLPMTTEDPRFDGALCAYSAAIDYRRMCERIGR
jgi:hypothetical protein